MQLQGKRIAILADAARQRRALLAPLLEEVHHACQDYVERRPECSMGLVER